MAKKIIELDQEDIIRILAERYGVDKKKVIISISPAYDGGQFDSSPGSVSFKIQSPVKSYEND